MGSTAGFRSWRHPQADAMKQGNRLKPANKRLLVIFLAITILPGVLAAWLAWSLLDQDFILARERLREIRERRADEVVQHLTRALGALAQQTRSLPAGAVSTDGTRLAYAAQ